MQRRSLMSRAEREDELALFHDMHTKKEGERKSNAVHPLMSNALDEVSFVKLTGSSISHHMTSSTTAASIAALKSSKNGDDLLTADLGKNDYDWLLTPPGTPLMNPPDHPSPAYGEDYLSHAVLPNLVRSLAAIKTSRLSSFKSEPIIKKEVSNGAVFSMRPDQGMRSTRNGMIRSNSAVVAGSSFAPNNGAMSMMGRRTPVTPTSRPTSRPTTPTKRSTTSSTPASRPTTPTSRPRAPSSAPVLRPETPTSRSRAAPTPLSRPSTPSGRATSTPFFRNAENNAMSSSSTLKGSVPSRPSTPLRRPIAPQAQPQSVSATATRSSSITKQRPPPSRSTPSSRGSSPTIKPNTWQQLSDIPGFSLEPPPNLRTSLPSRPSSNSRGASVSTSRPGAPSAGNGVATSMRVHSDVQPEKVQDIPTRRPSSPMVARGRSGSLSSFTGERPSSNGTPVARTGGRLDRSPSESVVVKGTKVVDRMMPSRRPFPSSLSPETVIQTKHASRPGTPTASKDNAGFARSTPRKSTDLSMRHMELRQSATIGLRSLIRNTPTSSLYSARPAGMRGPANNSPIATSSNASSDYGMSIMRDPEGSEVGEEFISEAGSKASPASLTDSLSSVVKNGHTHSWLGSPEDKNGTPEPITQSTPEANQDAVEQNLENIASTDSCLACRHGCVPANCDLCNMKIRLQKLNEKCRASLRASLHVSEESHINSSGNGTLK